MPQIILYIATSVDGYIADADGGVGWLPSGDAGGGGDGGGSGSDAGDDGIGGGDDFGYAAFYGGVDALLMGRRTYDQALGFGDWPYPGKPTYVFTGHPPGIGSGDGQTPDNGDGDDRNRSGDGSSSGDGGDGNRSGDGNSNGDGSDGNRNGDANSSSGGGDSDGGGSDVDNDGNGDGRPPPGVVFVGGDVGDFVRSVARRYGDGGALWLVGGANLAEQFRAAGLIDEYRIFVIPVILGRGIPLFDGGVPAGSSPAGSVPAGDGGAVSTATLTPLRLVSAQTHAGGIVELRYHPASASGQPQQG